LENKVDAERDGRGIDDVTRRWETGREVVGGVELADSAAVSSGDFYDRQNRRSEENSNGYCYC